MSGKLSVSQCAALATALITISIPACSGRHENLQPQQSSGSQRVLTTLQARDSLARMQPAKGVDATVFEQLRQALASELAGPDARITYAAPQSEANRVMDLELSHADGRHVLSWSFQNLGDYDQNGEVNVSDLTPLGINFGSLAPAAGTASVFYGPLYSPFGRQSALSVVDGDGNGEVSLSDVTVIGQNFGNSIGGFNIYASTDYSDFPEPGMPSPAAPLASIDLSAAEGSPAVQRLGFSHELQDYDPGMTYWLRPFSGGHEGIASNPAGAGFILPSGSLGLQSVQPGSALPGQTIELVFSQPLPADLSGLELRVNGKLTVPLQGMPRFGNRLACSAPLLGPGEVRFELLDGGEAAGSASLTMLPAQTSIGAAELAQSFEDATAGLCDAFGLIIPWFDEAGQQDLAEFESMMADMQDWAIQKLEAAPVEKRTQLLCFLEQSGYLDLLDMVAEFPKTGSRQASFAANMHFTWMRLDAASAVLSASRVAIDLLGVSTALLSSGTTIPAAMAVRLLITTIDNVIDTYIPTDLQQIRIDSSTRMLKLSPEQNLLVVDGRFCAENPVGAGSFNLLLEFASDGLSVPEEFEGSLLDALLEEINVSKLGTYLGNKLFQSLEPVDDDEDPCDGRIGGNWTRLDLQLYTLEDFSAVQQKVLYSTFLGWRSEQQGYDPQPLQVVSVGGNHGAALIDDSGDKLEIFQEGRYELFVNAWRYEAQSLAMFWQKNSTVPVSLRELVWAGRYGDWHNELVAGLGSASNDMFLLNTGTPVVVFEQRAPQDEVWVQSIFVAAPGDEGGWQATMARFDASLLSAAVLGGRPLVFFYEDGDLKFMVASDAAGMSWNSPQLLPYPASDAQMIVCGGVPAFIGSFSYEAESGVYYVAAEDPQASSWRDPVYVTNTLGTSYLLRNIGGVPAYIYQEVGDEVRFWYRAAHDSVGFSWAPEFMVADNSWYRQMEDVNGLPAVAYVQEMTLPPGWEEGDPTIPDRLYYTSAEDRTGGFWYQAVQVGEAAPETYYDSIGAVSIASISGLPAVVFDHQEFSLAYRQALDPLGSSWEPFQGVDSMSYACTGLIETGIGPLVTGISIHGDNIIASWPELEPDWK